MKIILNLTPAETVELVNATANTFIGRQVKLATLKAETKALKQAIVLTENSNADAEIDQVEAALTAKNS